MRRAGSGKFWKAEKWTGGVGLLATAIIYFAEPGAAGERMIAVETPLIFFASVLIVIVGIGFIFAPYQFFKEEKERAEMLDERQRPKLRIKTKADQLRSVNSGVTMDTLGGTRQTQIHGWEKVAVVYATNDGRDKLENVSCKLMAAWEYKNGEWNKITILESIDLSFDYNVNTPKFQIETEPNDTVCVYLARVTPAGKAFIYRKMTDLPVDYHQIFGGHGRYQLLMQFRSKLPDPLQALVVMNVRLPTQIEGKAPQGEADVSILKQGDPPQLPEGIEAKTLR